MKRRLSLLLCGLVAASATAAVGVAENITPEKIQFNAADQAVARAQVVRRTDLGPGTWTGGRVKWTLKAVMDVGDNLLERTVTFEACQNLSDFQVFFTD